MTPRHWRAVAGYGFVITASVMGALAIALVALDYPTERAVTVSFLTLAMAQLWHVFNMRGTGSGLIDNDVVRNPLVWGSLALCVVLLIGAVYLPHVSDLLRMSDPGLLGWATAAGLSLVPLVAGQARLAFSGTRLGSGARPLQPDQA